MSERRRSNPRFKDRYVLGTGYPWGIGTRKKFTSLALSQVAVGMENKGLEFPKELWRQTVPRYRLVLERVKERKKK